MVLELLDIFIELLIANLNELSNSDLNNRLTGDSHTSRPFNNVNYFQIPH